MILNSPPSIIFFQDDIYSVYQTAVTVWTPSTFVRSSLIDGRWDQDAVQKQLELKRI